jgi:hypothetical protein
MPRPARPSRKLHKHRVHLRLSQEGAEFLRKEAALAGCTTSDLVDHMILELRTTEHNYFTQSAAYFGFVACSLSLLTATKLLEPDKLPIADLATIKDDITKAAGKLFGKPPASPFRTYLDPKDDRLWQLYYAFTDHWLRREGDPPPYYE